MSDLWNATFPLYWQLKRLSYYNVLREEATILASSLRN